MTTQKRDPRDIREDQFEDLAIEFVAENELGENEIIPQKLVQQFTKQHPLFKKDIIEFAECWNQEIATATYLKHMGPEYTKDSI